MAKRMVVMKVGQMAGLMAATMVRWTACLMAVQLAQSKVEKRAGWTVHKKDLMKVE